MSEQSEPRVPSSELGRRSAKALDDPELTISSWLLERRVLTVARIPLVSEDGSDAPAVDSSSINKMIEYYDEMTGFLWPKEWTSMDAMMQSDLAPVVDPRVRPICEVLLEQYQKIAEEPWAKGAHLGSDHVKIMSGRLSALLSATIGTYTMDAARHGRSAHEVEGRHDWDAMLYRFYVQSTETISPNVLLEETLNFPKNEVADGLSNFGDLRRFTQLHATQCFYASAAVHDNSEASIQADAAQIQALCFKQEARLLSEDVVRARAKKEPLTGKCDAILVVPIQNTLELPASKVLVRRPVDFSVQPTPAQTSPPVIPTTPTTPPSELALLSEPPTVPTAPTATSSHLLLPTMVVEYKKQRDSESKALNQARTYSVSSVAFLDALGITDYPVFNLLTNGMIGSVILAWKTAESKMIYLMERNITTFDLSQPLQAFQFATFLLRLRDQDKRLQEIFKEKGKTGLAAWTKEVFSVKVGPVAAVPNLR